MKPNCHGSFLAENDDGVRSLLPVKGNGCQTAFGSICKPRVPNCLKVLSQNWSVIRAASVVDLTFAWVAPRLPGSECQSQIHTGRHCQCSFGSDILVLTFVKPNPPRHRTNVRTRTLARDRAIAPPRRSSAATSHRLRGRSCLHGRAACKRAARYPRASAFRQPEIA
jgi:hypothetical protein